MRLDVQWSLLLLHTLLFVAAVLIVTRTLKLLRRMEFVIPPIGARRMHFKFSYQSDFPCRLLPEAYRGRVESGVGLFLFMGAKCSLCHPLMRGLGSLARQYPDIQIVVVTKGEWAGLDFNRLAPTAVLVGGELSKELGIGMEPYALKSVGGKIVDFGIVNTMEQVENFLEAGATVV